jgi:cytochrome c oxidase assembly protein subunit 19
MDRCVDPPKNLGLTHPADILYRNLMAKDEFKNLGFGEDKAAAEPKKDEAETSKKGELRW